MNINDFNINVKEGGICEDMVRDKFKVVFEPILQQFVYGNSITETQKQRNGIDFNITHNELSFDVKCRDFYAYQFKDILLETVSVVEDEKPGWLYSSKSDVIVYVWKNETGKKFIDGYLLFMNNIREFLKQYLKIHTPLQKRAVSVRGTRRWHTDNIAIPIKDFNSDCIKKINIKELYPPQQDVLSKWFE